MRPARCFIIWRVTAFVHSEGFDVEVSIPKWDIEDIVNIYGDEEKYYIDDYSGWEVEFFYKEDFTLAQAIENYYHPIED